MGHASYLVINAYLLVRVTYLFTTSSFASGLVFCLWAKVTRLKEKKKTSGDTN